MLEFIQSNKVVIWAILSGLVPAMFWLWFWFKEEDDDDTEPIGLVLISFILGGLLVFVAIWLEKYSLNFIKNETERIIIWAAIEELIKFVGVMAIILKNENVDRPIDYPMYFIAVALGFAALENILYLINPFSVDGVVVGVMTGNLRFLGSTLLHAISSAMIGSAMGLSFYLEKYRKTYLLIGIICAIVLHSVFNFFIMEGSGKNPLSVFGFLWVVTIINILIFEKLKRMNTNQPVFNH